MIDLLELRKEIDQIDSEIVRLYEERMKISENVAKYKIATGKKVFDKEREDAKITALKAQTHNDFNCHGIEELFIQIMSMSRKLQYQLLTREGVVGRLPFTEVDHIETEKARVVFQGVEGAYSQAAMKAYFGDEVNSFHVDKWRDALEAIMDGMADFAVLPIENSTAGFVSEIYDLLMKYDDYIVGEQVIRIEHRLLGLPGAKLSDIKKVYSHEQGLMQCEAYLNEHRSWEQISVENTAVAAARVSKSQDPTQAAIASALAGEIFGLETLEKDICANAANSTRFIIVTNQRVFRKDAKKISLCFETPHRSGSLYQILSHLIYNNLSMTKIESRPIPERNWEYRFFVDIEGNLNDSAVKNALRGITNDALNLKILGNY
ncbi:MAG: prephenate dehydratase domain-containing protein [Eubacteriales bacterium]|nr:prephenate dehydratase domain-containing protein [Eubacteriales bacterium]